MKLKLILEKSGGDFGGRVHAPGFLFTTMADTVAEVEANIRELIADFLEHEGREHPEWAGVTADSVAFEYRYDLTTFFQDFDAVKVNAIARLAGLNASMVRQYASGVKYPSEKQLKKLRTPCTRWGGG